VTIGERLRKARAKSGKRQADIAREVGVAQPTVCAWEADTCLPEAAKVRAVAKAYGLEPLKLLPPTPRKQRPEVA
jgi:transcriptional regulator with XRE-family HTH domain